MAYEWTSDGKTGTGFGYDTSGRTTNESECTPSTCGTSAYGQGFAYDLAGNQTSDSNGFGVTTNISYDGSGRAQQVTSNLSDSNHPSPLWTANAYNAFGLTQATLGNGIIENVGYDTRERRTSDSFTDPADNIVYNYSLGYYPNSSVQTANDKVNGNWLYTVDNMNRLLTASASSGPWAGDTLQWGIDSWGNRNSQTLTAGSVAVPQPTFSSNTNNQIAGYCYDAAGNLLDEGNCQLSGPQEYTYDGVGRLISPDYGNTTYVYDASGKRVAKESNGVSNTEYLYDLSGNEITNIAAQTSYLWLSGEVYVGNRHIASYIDGTTFFAHADWLGNERVHSKMDASIQDSCANLPFGDALTCPIYGVNALHFTGKLRDAESGNDYFGARYYVSTMARFQSPDWSAHADPVPYAKLDNPQSLNLYSYVSNNPASGVDLDGHQNQVPDADGPWSLAGSFCATEIGSASLANCEDTAYYGSGGWTGWGTWAQEQNAQGQTVLPIDYTLHVPGWGTPLDCASDPVCQNQYKQFFGKIPAPLNAPNNGQSYSFLKSWWNDVSSCFTNYALPALKSDLNPLTPGVLTPADMASQLSQASLAGAASWSVANGLTVPLRSSVVRAGVSNAEALGKATPVLALAGIDAALADAVYAEYKGCL